MSGWKFPPEEGSGTGWFWEPCTKTLTDDEQFAEFFEVQQYIGPLERLYLYSGYSDGNYRIITKPPIQRVIATAENKTKVQEFIHLAHIEILPRVKGLSNEVFHVVLPTLLEKLSHQTTLNLLRDWNMLEEDGMHEVDLATVIEGIKNDSLMMSITFEYDYKYPPPAELLCATCMLPAIDPHVSPYFLGKVFCHSCTAFEGSGYFLKANNLASLLDQLQVYCPFTSFGCDACLPRGDLGTHLEQCPYVRIVCVNKQHGCNFGAKSKVEAIEHMQTCEFASNVCRDITESRQNFNPNSNLPSLPLPSHFLPKLRDVVNTNKASAPDKEGQEVSKRKCKNCAVDPDDEQKKKLERVKKGGEKEKEKEKNEKEKEKGGEKEKEKGEKEKEKESTEAHECSFHSGTWCGYTQVQEWRYMVWRQRLNAGVKCIVHFPLEVAKSTTALGVGIVSFSAIVAGAFVAASSVFLPEMLIAGGFLLMAPAPVTSFVAGTVFSPTVLYSLLYKLPYNLIWGKAPPKLEEPEAWTCCNRLGSNAEPCETRGLHSFD